MQKPSLFIGSSVEGLDVAYALQENLEYDAEPTVWTQGIFRPTRATLHDLVAAAKRADFAAFLLTPDDVQLMRDEHASTPRDNVVFELGLFVGARGAERCFLVTPRDTKVRLPTDLVGLTPLTYIANRQDGNIVAALGPAANAIRLAMRRLGVVGVREVAEPRPEMPSAARLTLDFIHRWNSEPLAAARKVARGGMPLHMVEDETGEATEAMRRLFAFLESMAAAVLAGELDETLARAEFAAPLHAIWNHASVFLAPLNQADEWWEPLPNIAVLDQRWRGRPR